MLNCYFSILQKLHLYKFRVKSVVNQFLYYDFLCLSFQRVHVLYPCRLLLFFARCWRSNIWNVVGSAECISQIICHCNSPICSKKCMIMKQKRVMLGLSTWHHSFSLLLPTPPDRCRKSSNSVGLLFYEHSAKDAGFSSVLRSFLNIYKKQASLCARRFA